MIFPAAPKGAVDDSDYMTKYSKMYYDDIDWFYSNYGKFKDSFRNKFVVVKNQNIILSSHSIERLKSDAKKNNIDLTKCVVKFVPVDNMDTSFSAIRAVKVLDSEMQKEARDLGYKPNDIVLIIRVDGRYIIADRIDGSIVEWQRKNGMIIGGE